MFVRRLSTEISRWLALCACACAIALTGCGSNEPDPGPWEPVAPEFMEDPRFGVFVSGRIDAVLGTPLVVLIELAGGFPAEDVGPVVLDDGRELETGLYWIGVKPGEAGTSWLVPSGEWTARTVDEVLAGSVPRGEVGTWALVVDPPIDAVGQGLWIAGQRRTVNWLPDPTVVAARVSSRAWLSPLAPVMRESSKLRYIVEAERTSPFRRWRYKLMVGELSPVVERRIVELDGSVRRPERSGDVEWAAGRLVSGVLETLARQQESKWAIALARLDQADDELAEAVRRRLCAVVDFGAGELAPVWPVQQEGIDRLLSDLLDQQLTPRERARRARIWLDEQSTSVAWVVSDAPRVDGATGQPRTVIAAANVDYESKLTSVSSLIGGESSDLSTLAPLTARAYEVTSRVRTGETPIVVARVGEEEHRLSVGGAKLVAQPPGLRLDQFAGDWTLASMLAGAPSAWPGGETWHTRALLYREPAGRWMLFVQCGSQDNTSAEERVRVTLGAEGSSSDLVIELSPVREAFVEFGGGVLNPVTDFAPEVEIDTFPGGWSARLVVPERVIESRGEMLRIGIERRDALARRSAWPRAMLPWQGSCARAAIDLSQWGGLGTR